MYPKIFFQTSDRDQNITTITEDRVTGLALLYVYKNPPIQVEEVINRIVRKQKKNI